MVQSLIGNEQYKVTHSNGRHTFYGDEPEALGGKDTAPAPDELPEAALASCTLVTLRMYTNHKQWNAGDIKVSVSLIREKDKSIINRELQFEHEVNEEQKQRLMQVAKACPVSKTLSGNAEMIVNIN
ncbi:MAG: OsmC family protein [Chitinophagaceae bacterium]|nr:OsmC family protein [Chitinophagaceae bacterium]